MPDPLTAVCPTAPTDGSLSDGPDRTATLEVLSDPAFNLAEFLAETAHADAHPKESMSWERFKEALALKAEHGDWPDW